MCPFLYVYSSGNGSYFIRKIIIIFVAVKCFRSRVIVIARFIESYCNRFIRSIVVRLAVFWKIIFYFYCDARWRVGTGPIIWAIGDNIYRKVHIVVSPIAMGEGITGINIKIFFKIAWGKSDFLISWSIFWGIVWDGKN